MKNLIPDIGLFYDDNLPTSMYIGNGLTTSKGNIYYTTSNMEDPTTVSLDDFSSVAYNGYVLKLDLDPYANSNLYWYNVETEESIYIKYPNDNFVNISPLYNAINDISTDMYRDTESGLLYFDNLKTDPVTTADGQAIIQDDIYYIPNGSTIQYPIMRVEGNEYPSTLAVYSNNNILVINPDGMICEIGNDGTPVSITGGYEVIDIT